MERDANELNVVHEQDLEEVLRKAGLLERLQENTLKCKFCGINITLENIHSLLPQAEGFSLICDEPRCVQALSEYLLEKNKGVLG